MKILDSLMLNMMEVNLIMLNITKKIHSQRREDKFKKVQKKFDREWEKEEKRILSNLDNKKAYRFRKSNKK